MPTWISAASLRVRYGAAISWKRTPKVTIGTPGKDQAMVISPSLSGTTEKMKSVKANWNLAPDGPQKDKAQIHIARAEKALASHHDGECNRELDSATYALS